MDARGGDTIAALSSGRPPAAVAIIRTSGPAAHAVALAICGELPSTRQAALRTLRHPVSGDPLDTALVLRFDAPHSATGEDIVEYQCHGGRAVVAAVLDAVTSCPHICLAEPGEFTRRALASGRIDLTEAEGLADLLEAESELQRRSALLRAGGGLSRQIEQWRSVAVDLSARVEAAIDYVGDENETSVGLDELRADALRLGAELDEWLARPRVEPLRDGIRVVVAGPPNVGKSSLVNALSQSDRSIVTAIPGTTRDSIDVPLTLAGVPFILVDTAGLRETTDLVEAIGVDRARAEAEDAQILLWLGDPIEAPAHPCCVTLAPKADLMVDTPQGVDISVSAKTGQGLAALFDILITRGNDMLPVPDRVALNRRQALAIGDAADSLRTFPDDLLIMAEHFRAVRFAFDRLTGRAGIEDALDALFGRFCLGK